MKEEMKVTLDLEIMMTLHVEAFTFDDVYDPKVFSDG